MDEKPVNVLRQCLQGPLGSLDLRLLIPVRRGPPLHPGLAVEVGGDLIEVPAHGFDLPRQVCHGLHHVWIRLKEACRKPQNATAKGGTGQAKTT